MHRTLSVGVPYAVRPPCQPPYSKNYRCTHPSICALMSRSWSSATVQVSFAQSIQVGLRPGHAVWGHDVGFDRLQKLP